MTAYGPLADLEVVSYAGAPVDGTSGTGAGLVSPGSLLIDTTNTNLYMNTNTKASPTWSLLSISTLSAAEQGYLDGATAGTQVASKCVVADANVNTGVSKVTELHIGATGAETQVTSTAAEINVLDGVTPGTAAASKAMVLDASSQIDTFTTTADLTTTAGVGAKAGATVAAVENGDGVIHRTVLTLTATPIAAFGDEAGQGQYGGVKIYDFPEGLILTLGAVIDGAVTLTAPAIDTWDGDIGLGVEVVTDHQDAANKIGQILQSTATTQAVGKVATTDAVTIATLLTESGARWRDGTATAVDLYLNVLVDDDAAHDNTITGTFTGTVTITWIKLGDK
jgi:hypothetical protein